MSDLSVSMSASGGLPQAAVLPEAPPKVTVRVRLEREAILWLPAGAIALHKREMRAIAIEAVGATILLLLDSLDEAKRLAKRIAKADIS
jgi:hypothetical protein